MFILRLVIVYCERMYKAAVQTSYRVVVEVGCSFVQQKKHNSLCVCVCVCEEVCWLHPPPGMGGWVNQRRRRRSGLPSFLLRRNWVLHNDMGALKKTVLIDCSININNIIIKIRVGHS